VLRVSVSFSSRFSKLHSSLLCWSSEMDDRDDPRIVAEFNSLKGFAPKVTNVEARFAQLPNAKIKAEHAAKWPISNQS
jgi:hypothetical protein